MHNLHLYQWMNDLIMTSGACHSKVENHRFVQAQHHSKKHIDLEVQSSYIMNTGRDCSMVMSVVTRNVDINQQYLDVERNWKILCIHVNHEVNNDIHEVEI